MTTVLIVDDSPTELHLFQTMLEKNGFVTLVADSGEDGIKQATSSRPDIILMDVVMPGMNGYELAKEIRSIKALKGLLLIALTGYGQEDDRNAAFQAGFDKHMTKPTRPSQLCEYIASKIAR